MIKKIQMRNGTMWPYNGLNYEICPGDKAICALEGKLYRIEESRGRDKAALGDLTPVEIKPPEWAKRAILIDGVGYWTDEDGMSEEITRKEFDGALADAGLYECGPQDHYSDPGCDSCLGVQKAKAYADQQATKLQQAQERVRGLEETLHAAAVEHLRDKMHPRGCFGSCHSAEHHERKCPNCKEQITLEESLGPKFLLRCLCGDSYQREIVDRYLSAETFKDHVRETSRKIVGK